MAYFSNSTEGAIFDEQCSRCVFGERDCPIALVQMLFNYDQVGNKTAEEIMNNLVDERGVCQMRDKFKELRTDGSKQLNLL